MFGVSGPQPLTATGGVTYPNGVKPANSPIDTIANTAGDFTVALNSDSTVKASNTMPLEIWLEGAAAPVAIKPVVKTTEKDPTYKLTTKTVTLNSTAMTQAQEVRVVPSASNIKVSNLAIGKPDSDGGVVITPNYIERERVVVTVPKGTPAGSYNFTLTPDGTKALTLTVKVVPGVMTADIKVEKGSKIDAVDRENTQMVYAPSVKNNGRTIESVRLVSDTSGSNAYTMFDAMLTADKKVTVTMKKGAVHVKGTAYKMRLEFTFSSAGASAVPILSGDITIKPVQGAVKHSIPKSTNMFQSRTGAASYETILLTPATPAGAKIAKIEFKPETVTNGYIAKHVNNPNNAYDFSFDSATHELKVWLKDGAGTLVAPGKATLVLNVVYEGHHVEKNTKEPAPVVLKIPLTVVK